MIRGNVRERVPRNIGSSWKADIHNRFDIEVRDANTNQIKQKAQAFNVICDNLWSRMSSYFGYIVYGTGTGTPSASDKTTFGTWYAVSASNHTQGNDIASGVSYRTRKIVLNETAAVGVTITEVGLASSNSSGNLCTHAMLQDMNGNPISIRKTSTDILTIYATVYVHWTPSGQNGITLAPPFNSSVSSSYCNFLEFALGYGFQTYSGSVNYSYAYLYASQGTTRSGYSNGDDGTHKWDAATKTLTHTFTRAAVDKFNVPGGFGWLMFKWANSSTGLKEFCIIDVRDAYEVTSEAVGTGDGTTTHFATKFDMPTNAKVYVDGVAMTSGVTVRPTPTNDDAMAYMVSLRPELHDNKPCYKSSIASASIGSSGGKAYLYNPLHDTLGIAYFTVSSYSSYLKVATSDDMVNWSDEYNGVIPEEYRYRKYLRLTNTHTSQGISMSGITARFSYIGSSGSLTASSSGKVNNIIFDTPPAAGSVITIDYTTPFVPKDENHVYDLSMSVQFGEYTEN